MALVVHSHKGTLGEIDAEMRKIDRQDSVSMG